MKRSLGSALISWLVISGMCFGQTVILDGTKIRLRLEQTLSSATAQEGQPVQLSVSENVKVGDRVVIVQGASAVGSVILAQPKRRMGRTGKLDFSVDRVTTADGESIPVRYSPTKKEGGSHAVRTGVITAGVAVVFWPAAPFMLLMKGKDAKIERGLTFEVFTDQNHVLGKPASSLSKTSEESAPNRSSPATVEIASAIPGDEIELDGQFVGNTPTTLQIPAGPHQIVVKSGSAVWQKDLQVYEGSSISLNAVFRPGKSDSATASVSDKPKSEPLPPTALASPKLDNSQGSSERKVEELPKPSQTLEPRTRNDASAYLNCPESMSEVEVHSSPNGLKSIKCGEAVKVLSHHQSWIRVRANDGREGSVPARFIVERQR